MCSLVLLSLFLCWRIGETTRLSNRKAYEAMSSVLEVAFERKPLWMVAGLVGDGIQKSLAVVSGIIESLLQD